MMTENYLSTTATFPITYGTAITVACDPQYLLMGSKVITCEKGIVYFHLSSRPQCVNPGKLVTRISDINRYNSIIDHDDVIVELFSILLIKLLNNHLQICLLLMNVIC